MARLGLIGGAQAKASGTTLTLVNSTGAILAAGTVLAVVVACDNRASVTPPTVTVSTLTGGGSWTQRGTPLSSGESTTAGTGVHVYLFTRTLATAVAAGAGLGDVTFSAAVVARVATISGWTAVAEPTGTVHSATIPGGGTLPTLSETLAVGDVAIAAVANESSVVPSSSTRTVAPGNAPADWSSAAAITTSGGSAATNVAASIWDVSASVAGTFTNQFTIANDGGGYSVILAAVSVASPQSGTLDAAGVLVNGGTDLAGTAVASSSFDVAPNVIAALDVTGTNLPPAQLGTLDAAALLAAALDTIGTPGATARTFDAAGVLAAAPDLGPPTIGPSSSTFDAPTVAAGAWDPTGSIVTSGTLDVAALVTAAPDPTATAVVSRSLDVAGAVVAAPDPSGSAAISRALDVAGVLSAALDVAGAPGAVSGALDVATAASSGLDLAAGVAGPAPQSSSFDVAILVGVAPDVTGSSSVSRSFDVAGAGAVVFDPVRVSSPVGGSLDLATAALAVLEPRLGAATAAAVLDFAALVLDAIDPTGAQLEAWLAEIVFGTARPRWEALPARTRQLEEV